MSSAFGSGLHAAPGRPVDAAAHDKYLGRWSRLFVPAVLAAAEVAPGNRVLDISCGPGEASLMALAQVGASGSVIGADIAPAMLVCARQRLNDPSFLAVAADGQALPFADGSFDALVCQLGLQFFSDPDLGLQEFRRVVRHGCCAAVCVNPVADRAPMWGILADVLSRVLPHQRAVFQSSFSLSDPERLRRMFVDAGFRDISVVREERDGVVESLDEYWQPIEAGTGSMPQAYIALSEPDRRAVREEVTARLARFASNGGLRMSLETLIGRGRA